MLCTGNITPAYMEGKRKRQKLKKRPDMKLKGPNSSIKEENCPVMS